MGPHPRLVSVASLAALLASGCYVSHEGSPTPRTDTGIRRDTGPFPVDSGTDTSRPRMDSSFDSDLPPDSRPPDSSRPDSSPPDTSRPDSRPRDTRPPIDSGRPSRALSFERGDRVFVTPSVTLDITDSHTYELWMRPRVDGLVLHKGTVAPGERYQYLIEVRGGAVIVGWATEDGDALIRAPIRMNDWNHVSVVIDANAMTATIQLFVDGFEVANALFPNTLFEAINDQPLLMGGFDGDIDEVRLFTFARVGTAIRTTMRTRLMPPPPGMEAYWPLEESGQIVLDRSLRGNEGVLGDFTFADPADPTWITDGPIP